MCTRDVQLLVLVVHLFNGCTAFQEYTYEDYRICTALEKTVDFGTKTIVNENKSQGETVPKSTDFFFGCTAF